MKNTIPKWYNTFSIYIDFILEINNIYVNKIDLSFEKRYDEPFAVVKPIIEISTLVSRIIPFSIKEQGKKVKYITNDNLDYLSNEIEFVRKDLNEIFSKYKKLLFKLGLLRNKYEHVPHLVSAKITGGSEDSSDVTYIVPNRANDESMLILIGTDELAYLIMDLNSLISEISKQIIDDIEKNHKNFSKYPYTDFLRKAIALSESNLLP